MAYFVALAVLLAGCGTMDPGRLDEAVALVWHGQYRAPADAPPPAVEIHGERCIRRGDGVCVDGAFDPEAYAVRVGLSPSYGASSLAHELYHADEFRRHGDCDAGHAGRGWGWYVPDADGALADAGL